MRIDDFRQHRAVQALTRSEQRERERDVLHVSGIDYNGVGAAFQKNVVRRHPVANEDVHLRRDHLSFAKNSRTSDTRSSSVGATCSMRMRSGPAKRMRPSRCTSRISLPASKGGSFTN